MPLTFLLENRLVSWLAARVIAVSQAVGDALVRRGTPRRKLTVIHNGVVIDRIDVPMSPRAVEEWKTRIGWDPSRRTIGIVARLKDQEVVIRALDRVRFCGRAERAGAGAARGRPVMASAATGNLELVRDNQNGRLVSARDPAAWAAAIERTCALYRSILDGSS